MLISESAVAVAPHRSTRFGSPDRAGATTTSRAESGGKGRRDLVVDREAARTDARSDDRHTRHAHERRGRPAARCRRGSPASPREPRPCRPRRTIPPARNRRTAEGRARPLSISKCTVRPSQGVSGSSSTYSAAPTTRSPCACRGLTRRRFHHSLKTGAVSSDSCWVVAYERGEVKPRERPRRSQLPAG